ncbi:phage terminase small subunit-related protein [Terribacillus aidingensis]|uniref:phage terminase small subunit-related protein n=1 Tax=Terribacillus aidingensis TaxID=586416 RepID=UPI00344F214B
MARPRNPKRDEAFRLWKEKNGTKALKEIAAELDVGDSQIRKWKNQDRWEDQLNGNVTKRGSKREQECACHWLV